jgi:hypothetical protein
MKLFLSALAWTTLGWALVGAIFGFLYLCTHYFTYRQTMTAILVIAFISSFFVMYDGMSSGFRK